jgi:acetyltransferase-like isoleucine patch superfamily enzyme/acyl carrier protein
MINRGGEKIAPREVDEVLLAHADVAQAVTFAVPHPTLGEDVGAAIVLREHAAPDVSSIRAFAAARLADFKIPNQILIVNEIPKGPTGKLQRIGLAEKLKDQLELAKQKNFVGARTSVEGALIEVWKEVLRLDHVGVRDNFFAVGGDSLATAGLLAAVEARFNKSIRLDAFLKSPTIETLSQLLEEDSRDRPLEQDVFPRALKDTRLRGMKNRLLQVCALYAPGFKSTRVWLHRRRGVAIGANVSIGLSAIIETAYPSLVYIGNNVSIGMRALIIGHLRDATSEARMNGQHTVRIEDGAYIGPGVIILPNVVIGEGAVVSAGSVVSRSVPPRTLVRGNPAEPIARCGVSLGGGVSYEEFVRQLAPIKSAGDLAGVSGQPT